MRSSQPSPALVLGVPRVRAARPAPVVAPEPDLEVDVVVEVAPEPIRAPMRTATPPVGTRSVQVRAPVSVHVRHHTLTPPAAFALPTPPVSYPAPTPSQQLLTPAEGVALPPRGTSHGDVDAMVWLSRVARSIPTRVAEHFVTFGVATFSFAFLAAVIATFGGNQALPKDAPGAAQEPRAGYTRPAVEKIATGPLAETGVPAPSQTLGMMQVKPPSRTVTINRVIAAAAPADAARRAAPPPPPPPPAAAANDIPQDREPVLTTQPKAPVVTPPPAAPPTTRSAKVTTPPARHDPPPPPQARPHAAPEPKGSTESSMAQHALDEARGEDTSLSGH